MDIWVEKGEYLISLGVPLGNDFDSSFFLSGVYRAAKAKLSSVSLVSRVGLIGKQRLLNANFYGKLRYYLWSMLLPNSMLNNIDSDANAFLWRRNPGLEASESGSNRKLGKFISRKASYRRLTAGGAGLLDLRAHCKAFSASWIRRLLEPRGAPYKRVIDHWLPCPRGHLLSNLTHTYKKHILLSIPPQAVYFREALRNF